MATRIVKLVIAILALCPLYLYFSTCDVVYWRIYIDLWVLFLIIDTIDLQFKIRNLERELKERDE